MKLLVLSLLICAVMALTRADPVDPPQNELNDEGENEESGDKVKRSFCDPRSGTWYPHGGRQYVFITSPKPWAQAQVHCLSLGGNLATVHNSGVNDFVKNLARGNPAWIGFSDAQLDGYWLWINSERLVYSNWCGGEPNNYRGQQDCGLINWSGGKCWDDQSCKTSLPFVCEKK